MNKKFIISSENISLKEITSFVLNRGNYFSIEISNECKIRIEESHLKIINLLESRTPIYGVTTGFGDSCFRSIPNEKSEELQANLISYLLCGTGPILSPEASRAVFLSRLISLSRGYSGVSFDLIERMRMFLERDWIPVIPSQGSLGASGDLVPLAYLARILQGEGSLFIKGEIKETKEVLGKAGVSSYRLKTKEGLAIVNGTSTMSGLCLVNLNQIRFLLDLICVASSWLCISLRGRKESFGVLINEKAKKFVGQKIVAQRIRQILEQEEYRTTTLAEIKIHDNKIQEMIQDRYSLRCTPQILGPIMETIEEFDSWLDLEINGVSDNPLVDEDGELQMGGNFYGGYLSHGMDYLKICLGHMADLIDRQLMSLIDEKSNRGLPPNLAAWNLIPKEDQYLHHGLKGLHQSVSAITSEVLAKATPNGIFSRSSESHNQDKVSLGMSGAVQCSQIIEQMHQISAMYFICLTQALDLREFPVRGEISRKVYSWVRDICPFVEGDRPLDLVITDMAKKLKELSKNQKIFIKDNL
jgi:histidine ammonia-lyase/phenylalanine ammonia-lyase